MNYRLFAAVLFLSVLSVLQTALLPRFPIFAMTPNLLLVSVIAWTVLSGMEAGIQWGFVAGILLDLFSISPLGLQSLGLIAAVLAIGFIQRSLPKNRVLLPLALGAIGTFLFYLTYLVLLWVTGNVTAGGGSSFQSAGALVRLLIFHALLTLPVYTAFFWFRRAVNPRQVAIDY